MQDAVPFLLESRLRELGADFQDAQNWSDNVVVDGKLITGQNPQSSGSIALSIVNELHKETVTA
jgi:putative intracellular protease/amidase